MLGGKKKTNKDVKGFYKDYNIKGVNNKLVFSQNECNYKEILEDIETSSKVIIFTYSIGKMDKLWLKKLKNLKNSIEIHILVNNLTLSKDMLQTINPEKFNSNDFTLYLCPVNHSKIFYTDKKLYIGSQNLGSTYKFEAGIVVDSTPDIFKQVYEQLKNLEEYSTKIHRKTNYPFFEEEKLISIHQIYEEGGDLVDEANELVWGAIKERKDTIEAYIASSSPGNAKLNRELLTRIQEFIGCLEEDHSDYWQIDQEIIKCIEQELVNINKDVDNLESSKSEIESTNFEVEDNVSELEDKIIELEENNRLEEIEDIEIKINNENDKIDSFSEQLVKIEDVLTELEMNEVFYSKLRGYLILFEDIEKQREDCIQSIESDGFVTEMVTVVKDRTDEHLTLLDELGIDLVFENEKEIFRENLNDQKEFIKNKNYTIK
ncbi:hypothetical protein SFC50_03085 [Bacillus infantis]|uniref:hypothetical protein n=1 Tax=Bacillus infantis TaxID=324767 RepID=UPI003981B879